jgi:hypothetical protein
MPDPISFAVEEMTADHIDDSGRRLFLRTTIPMRIVSFGQDYPVESWFLGGLSLAKPCALQGKPGDKFPVQLQVTLGGVNVTLDVVLRLMHDRKDSIGFSFEDISSEQLGVLRALLVRSGGLSLERLPALPAPDTKTSRTAPARKSKQLRRHPILGGLALRCMLAFGFIGLLAGSLVVSSLPKDMESVHAAVAVPAARLVSPDRGYVDQVFVHPGENVSRNKVLMTIRRRAEPASVVTVASPCDCQVLEISARDGEEVRQGQGLVRLARWTPADLVLEALLPPDGDVAVGRQVKVLLEGSERPAFGRVVSVSSDWPAETYGLPKSLRVDPQARIMTVSVPEGLEGAKPGQAARLKLLEYGTVPDRIYAAVDKLVRLERK